ncbi:MAG: NHL repeat-containing protein [Nitrososphaerales archaeon]|jgi:secreted PhoX family phosphatase
MSRFWSMRVLIPAVLGILLLSPMGFAHAYYSGENAALEIGQAAGPNQFTTNAGAATVSSFNLPHDVAFDLSGNMWVSDTDNNRILEFAYPFSDGEAASVEIGQPAGANAFTTSAPTTTATGLSNPEHIAFDSSGDLWVADEVNQRVLEFVPGTAPCASGQFCNGMGASIVIGQSLFTTHGTGTTASTFSAPKSLGFDASGNLWVVDQGNARVLEFTAPFSSGMSASVVIGQTSFTTHAPATTASGLSEPKDLAFSGGNLWVTDSGSRVLEYIPGTGECSAGHLCSGMSASFEVGQPAGGNEFTDNECGLTASTVCDIDGIAFDSSGDLWVGDHGNDRVLEFAAGSLVGTDGPSAIRVIGAPDFTTDTGTTTQSTLEGPSGLAFDSAGHLWVADNFNNRVMEFTDLAAPSPPPTTPVCPGTAGGSLMPAGATFAYGSSTFVAPSGNQGSTGTWSSYFFVGSQGTVPQPMMLGWAGAFGTYNGQQGWVVTFYC